jgi:hypothetical protein
MSAFLRASSGSLRRSLASSSSRSKAYRKTWWSSGCCRSFWKIGNPLCVDNQPIASAYIPDVIRFASVNVHRSATLCAQWMIPQPVATKRENISGVLSLVLDWHRYGPWCSRQTKPRLRGRGSAHALPLITGEHPLNAPSSAGFRDGHISRRSAHARHCTYPPIGCALQRPLRTWCYIPGKHVSAESIDRL